MGYNKIGFIALVLFSFILSGCSINRYQEPDDIDLIPVSQKAAKDLLYNGRFSLPKNSMVVISSFVNVNDLEQTSAFGRIVASQIGSAIFKSGYHIRSMELSTDKFVKTNSGFYQLTAEAKAALKSQGASALVFGVFAPGKKTAYVNVRMVDLNSQNVMASTDFMVPMGADAKILLKSRKTGSKNPEE